MGSSEITAWFDIAIEEIQEVAYSMEEDENTTVEDIERANAAADMVALFLKQAALAVATDDGAVLIEAFSTLRAAMRSTQGKVA